MNIIQAFILGIVEGITEFLPISSTFHLLITQQLLGLPDSHFLNNFIVIIQSGAILAAVALYGKRIAVHPKLFLSLVLSFIPTAIIGLVAHDFIKNTLFSQDLLQIISFMLVGVLFIFFEKYMLKKELHQSLDHISHKDAILIGLAQSLAVIPGVSRSGIVLLYMLWRGHSRSSAAEYTFMLGIPTLLAASLFDFIDLVQASDTIRQYILTLGTGWIVSFVVAIVAMKWFVEFLKKHDLSAFGWYRLGVGAILLAMIWFKY